MRYVKLIVLVLCLAIAALFFVQNQQQLLAVVGFKLNLYIMTLYPAGINIPLYVIIICAFLIGALLSFGFLLADKLHTSSQLRTCRKRLRSLEKEVNSLRNLPLQEQDSSAQEEEIMGA